ncbi:MAG TPA: hypothetical protein VF247_07085 [Candidatus Krumholzibacteria bacterium]
MAFRLAGAGACALVALGLAPGAAHALPKSLGYSFYVKGVPAGRADIKITESRKEIIFDSETRVFTGTDVIQLTSHTVADRKTYSIRDFRYQGTKGDHVVACQAQVRGDSVYGFVEMDGKLRDKHLKLPGHQNLLFEDWVMEHEILLALTQARSKNPTETYGLVFTSSFSPAEVTAGFTGEVLVEAGPRSLAARKLVIMIRGAEPFESHVDPNRGIPVYIRFPQSATEVFLDEVFGENPVTYFSTKEN